MALSDVVTKPIREWISTLRQSKSSPAEKRVAVRKLRADKLDQLEKVKATSEQAILEKDIDDLDAEDVVLQAEQKVAELATYHENVREWESDEESFRRQIAADLPAIEAKLDQWAAHFAARPRAPMGEPPVYSANDHYIYAARLGLIRAGEGLGLYDSGGTNGCPRLTPKSTTVQEWGVPLGRKA